MGRKAIPSNQRAQPISFSLKPHLIEKIDDYCHDHRFNRSKFLMEAVTQYMLKNDMGYHSDTNVMEMSVGRRVAIGLFALQEANREGELISKPIMDALRRELGMVEEELPIGEDNDEVEWEKQGNTYVGFINGEKISTIRKMRSKWVTQISGQMVSYKTLKEAKQDVEDFVQGDA